MDEDGFIRFEVNDQDIEEELNPGRGRRQTKEDQIYGRFLLRIFFLFRNTDCFV